MRRIIALALSLSLAACASGSSNPLAKLGAWISAAETAVNNAVAKVNSGIAASAPIFQDVCMGIGVMGTAFNVVAPALGASAADLANGQTGIAAGNALCAKTPTDIGSAVAQGIQVYKTVKDATDAVAPGALQAAATAPAS